MKIFKLLAAPAARFCGKLDKKKFVKFFFQILILTLGSLNHYFNKFTYGIFFVLLVTVYNTYYPYQKYTINQISYLTINTLCTLYLLNQSFFLLTCHFLK